MLPEAGPDDEPVEVFDQIGPLPTGFGPDGPVTAPQEPSQQSAEPQAPAPPPVSMSETGSFHLAPPPAAPAALRGPARVSRPRSNSPTRSRDCSSRGSDSRGSSSRRPHRTPRTRRPRTPSARRTLSQAPSSGVPHDPSATRPYTAEHQQLPPVPAPPVQHAAPHPPVRRTRPGPPPKVAVPVLVVALICFAVGIWALTQV